MSLRPTVSVIMCAYNEESLWLKEAIESILNQTYSDFEFIITLDNPLNLELDEIISEYQAKDSRIIYIKNEKNIGLVDSLNNELTLSIGKYIARMDADDICMLNRLQVQVDFLKANSKVDLVGSNIIIIGETGDVLSDNNNAPTDSKFIKKAMKYKNVFTHPTLMFKREVAMDEKIKGYRDILYAEDYDFVCRFITNDFMVTNIKDSLLKYRIRSTSITRINSLYQMKIKNYVIKMYKERLRHGMDNFSKAHIESLQINQKEKRMIELSNKMAHKSIYYKDKKWFLHYGSLFLASKLVNKDFMFNALKNMIYKVLYKISI
jgi:glycosyltransferase involved in cell wall biosynthesis